LAGATVGTSTFIAAVELSRSTGTVAEPRDVEFRGVEDFYYRRIKDVFRRTVLSRKYRCGEIIEEPLSTSGTVVVTTNIGFGEA